MGVKEAASQNLWRSGDFSKCSVHLFIPEPKTEYVTGSKPQRDKTGAFVVLYTSPFGKSLKRTCVSSVPKIAEYSRS
ncbi:hypothetical protein MSSIH_3220 [Methanosarcina siciliae HI350]|uniref:Uncharacterized protein n=1 Tax=Methanosarcina siciliae HI350 TaxID=1434119 RepID=A0A0E3PHF8_9EURY|nr:hypothetical protein [Methanosarcina siciliae]AKB33910.1 hypothetical protein MSSIH_3220 [Methanosarcina siciliae HI350]